MVMDTKEVRVLRPPRALASESYRLAYRTHRGLAEFPAGKGAALWLVPCCPAGAERGSIAQLAWHRSFELRYAYLGCVRDVISNTEWNSKDTKWFSTHWLEGIQTAPAQPYQGVSMILCVQTYHKLFCRRAGASYLLISPAGMLQRRRMSVCAGFKHASSKQQNARNLSFFCMYLGEVCHQVPS